MLRIVLLFMFLRVAMSTTAKGLPEFDKLWNYDNPDQTEQKFRELIPTAKESNNQEYYLQLLTQIARTQGLQKKFEEAHKTLDQVQKNLSSKTPVAEIRYFLERGRVFNSSKQAAQALPLFIKAFDLSLNLKEDNFAIDAAHMVAIAEPTSEKQMEWNLKAVSIAENSKEPTAQGWLGSLYNNIGWTYHDSGRFEQALEVFKKALAFREAKGEPSSIRIAKWSVARALRSLKKFDESLVMQKALEQEFDKLPQKDGYVFEELGELYLVLSKQALAKKYFAMAYKELSKDAWFKANEKKRLQRLKELGGVN